MRPAGATAGNLPKSLPHHMKSHTAVAQSTCSAAFQTCLPHCPERNHREPLTPERNHEKPPALSNDISSRPARYAPHDTTPPRIHMRSNRQPHQPDSSQPEHYPVTSTGTSKNQPQITPKISIALYRRARWLSAPTACSRNGSHGIAKAT